MTFQPLDRRLFLQGMGAAIALPWLDAMRSRRSQAAYDTGSSESPVRMAFVFVPNGVIVPSWTPTGSGTEYDLSETLSVLEPHKADFNVITGLAQDNGRPKGDGPGDHARSASTFLTGAHPVKTAGADIRVGISVDQVAAEKLGRYTRLPSLELGIEAGRNAGNCDSGYSCAYSNAISWKTPTTPMIKEIYPRLAFERLFGTAENSEAQARRLRHRKSILDVVAADAAKLQEKLGRTDRQKVDEYFTSVREIERRIEQAERWAEQPRPEVEIPGGIPENMQEHIHLMFDILVLAFQTDTTRVATFMLANEGSNRSYAMIDVKEGHHELSHHQSQEDKINKLKQIDKFLATQYGYFLDKLKSVKEGERTLLDNSLVLYGSGLGDGNRHNHDNLPLVLAGRGGMTIPTGRHIVYEKETPMNNLFLSMLDRVGAPAESIGDSTARLTELDG